MVPAELTPEALQIVDAHHHLWDLSTGRYDWLTGAPKPFLLGDYTALRRDYLPEDYRLHAHGLRVIATVHVEAECDRAKALDETRWVHEQHARTGMPNVVVAHTWFHVPGVEERLAAHKQHPLVRGIRSKPVTSETPSRTRLDGPGSMQDPDWRQGLKLLEKFDLSWDLRVPFWHLEEAAEVVREIPAVRVVLNHTGLPWDRSEEGLAVWRRGMRALAACPNVACKVSELGLKGATWTVESNRRVVREAIDIFGIERCMFASNFPVAGLRIGYRQQIAGFLRMLDGLSRAELDQFFRGTAWQFYRLG